MIEDDVFFKHESDEAVLSIGEQVFIGKAVEFDVIQKVAVGNHVLIAPGVFITDHKHDLILEMHIQDQLCVAQPVIIGNDVWIGAKAVILPGVTIADGAVIGASAVVNRDVARNAVVAGVPVRFLRTRSNEH